MIEDEADEHRQDTEPQHPIGAAPGNTIIPTRPVVVHKLSTVLYKCTVLSIEMMSIPHTTVQTLAWQARKLHSYGDGAASQATISSYGGPVSLRLLNPTHSDSHLDRRSMILEEK